MRIRSTYEHTNDTVLKDISSESHAIDTQLSQYTSISGRYETKFFYEQRPTPLVGGLSKAVCYIGTLQYHLFDDLVLQLVERMSAVIPGATNAESIGLNKDHIGLAKFEEDADGDFVILSR